MIRFAMADLVNAHRRPQSTRPGVQDTRAVAAAAQSSRRWAGRLVLAVVLLLYPCAWAGNAFASDGHCLAIRDCDEVWLVSTRHLQSGCRGNDFAVSYFDQGSWKDSKAEILYERINQDADRQNMVFVHGNRTDLHWARQRGLWVYRRITTSCESTPPIRYVIWAWPSDRKYRLLRDFRYKAQVADREGNLLGNFLARLKPAADTSFVAYSFGARLVLGGLHSAEHIAGRIRVALVAPATHRDWIFPGGRHQRAYERVNSMLLVTNRADPALRNYKVLERRAAPAALGEFGVNRSYLPDSGQKVRQFDVSRFVGRNHDIDRYFGSNTVIENVRRVAFEPEP